MKTMRALARHQKMTVVNGIFFFILLIIVLQLWILTATMNAFLGGDRLVILPAALVSLGCFLLNLGLLRYLFSLEKPNH